MTLNKTQTQTQFRLAHSRIISSIAIEHQNFSSTLSIRLLTLKVFQVLPCITHNSIKHKIFVNTQLKDQTVQFLTINIV